MTAKEYRTKLKALHEKRKALEAEKKPVEAIDAEIAALDAEAEKEVEVEPTRDERRANAATVASEETEQTLAALLRRNIELEEAKKGGKTKEKARRRMFGFRSRRGEDK